MLAQLLIRESVGLAAPYNLLKARRFVAEALATSSWDISVGTGARLDTLRFVGLSTPFDPHVVHDQFPSW